MKKILLTLTTLLLSASVYGEDSKNYKSIYSISSEKNFKISNNTSILGVEYDKSKIKSKSRMKKANEKFLNGGKTQDQKDLYDRENAQHNKKNANKLNSVKDVHDKHWRDFEEMNKYKKKSNMVSE